jgi:hypothetical protein
MMQDRELRRLFRFVNENPLENPFFLFRRRNTLAWFMPKPLSASILFVDMSAPVWAKADEAEIWQENIYKLHSRASRIIRTCHGRISKFIGDCVMAYFTGPDPEQHALWCAAALVETFVFYSLFTVTAHCLYGLPSLSEPRKPLASDRNIEDARNGLDRVEELFEAEDLSSLKRSEQQFLQDCRRATTDEKVRERRTKYLLGLMG